MPKRLLITRTEPEASHLANCLQEQGHDVITEPLMDVVYLTPSLPGVTHQALVATSGHALYSLEKNLNHYSALKHLPIFAVGERTAELCQKLQQKMNFQSIYQGPGTALELLETIIARVNPKAGPLLHIAAAKLAVDLTNHLKKHQIELQKCIVYETRERNTFSQNTKHKIMSGELDGVILMSPNASRIWARLIQQEALYSKAKHITAFCLSAQVAQPLESLAEIPIKVAAQPSQSAVLELL
ncbi:MAG: uroporphyrinogen-III synthase [Pseudomonadota bacterium]